LNYHNYIFRQFFGQWYFGKIIVDFVNKTSDSNVSGFLFRWYFREKKFFFPPKFPPNDMTMIATRFQAQCWIYWILLNNLKYFQWVFRDYKREKYLRQVNTFRNSFKINLLSCFILNFVFLSAFSVCQTEFQRKLDK